MAEFGRGAKAGVVAGLIIGALAAIIGGSSYDYIL